LSLPEFDSQIELFGLQLQRDKLFSSQDRYRLFHEKIYPVLVKLRERLETLYCQDNGRPAIEPVWVLGVSLLQFMERLPDRQALEHLKYHVGWKYALGHELEDGIFDPTVLVRFRQRLVAHDEERVMFEGIMTALEDAGLVKKRSEAQRLDSTHILGLVSRMSALDCVREALKGALEEIDERVRRKPAFWNTLWERYVEHELNYKGTAESFQAKRVQAGEDGRMLIAWLNGQKDKGGPKTDVFKRVFEEQYTIQEDEVLPRKALAKSIQNPHDPDASFRLKQAGKKWVGYSVQVAETVPKKGTGFITAMATQTAVGSDEAGMVQVLGEQKAMGFEKPKELYVDAAYISANALEEASDESRELIGPAVHARKSPQGKSVEDFKIDNATGQAICPAGEKNTQLSKIRDRTHGVLEYRYEWSWKCRACKLKNNCLTKGQSHRTVRVNSNFMYLQARRALMKTKMFRRKMRKRAGIEGTISEIVRGYGARRARYRGLAKMRLQNYFVGAACNVNRWLRRFIGQENNIVRGCTATAVYA
jgi:transposase